jgi:peptide deformylase
VEELPAGGTVRPITRWGEPVMHRALAPVTAFDDQLAALVADMVATMYAADGVGLAANQIGVDRSVFVFDCPDDDHVRHRGVVCNPRLTLPVGKDRNLQDADEGCLSYPGAFVTCTRPDWARVEGVDHTGVEIAYEGKGLLARCLQHETDHLHGTVFGDRLPQKLRRRLARDQAEVAADFPDDWPVGRQPVRSGGDRV